MLGGGCQEVFVKPDQSSNTEVVFNELKAECFPSTGADEWLINQTALPVSPLIHSHSHHHHLQTLLKHKKRLKPRLRH